MAINKTALMKYPSKDLVVIVEANKLSEQGIVESLSTFGNKKNDFDKIRNVLI